MVDAGSKVTLHVVLQKYEDGDVSGRTVSGLLLGINLGKPARIEGVVVVSENQKEVTKATIAVETSKNGFNLSYGYGGAKVLEKAFVQQTLDVVFN